MDTQPTLDRNSLEGQPEPSIATAPEPHSTTLAVQDLWEGMQKYRLWTVLSWHGLLQRFRRTWLGLGWISLSFLLFAGIKILIFGALSNQNMAFFASYLALGYLGWRLITNFITGGASTYLAMQNWIKSEPLPMSVYVYKLAATNLITFGFHAIAAIGLVLAVGQVHMSFFAWLPVVLLVYLVNGVWISIVLGAICTRHRDLLHLLTTLIQVLYFATPILWVPPESGLRAQIALYNPFTHFLDILRQPALTGVVPELSWIIVGVISVLGCLFGLAVFAVSRRRIVFWL